MEIRTHYEGDLVEFIIFEISNYNDDSFREFWYAYEPADIIAKYGIPSSIEMYIDYPTEPTSWVGFDVWLYYEHLGFLVTYQGAADPNAQYLLCPSIQNGNLGGSMTFVFQSPDREKPVGETAKFSSLDARENMDIQDILGVTVEEFAARLLEDNSTCFGFD